MYAVRASGPSPSRTYVAQTKGVILSTVMASSIVSFLHFAGSFKNPMSFPLETAGKSQSFTKEDTSAKASWTWQITSNLLHHLVGEYDGDQLKWSMHPRHLGLCENIPNPSLDKIVQYLRAHMLPNMIQCV